MQVSPLQLKQHFFTKVCVDQRDKAPKEPTLGLSDFSDVEVEVSLEHGTAADEVSDPRNFVVRLGMKFDPNKRAKVPYDLSVEVLGYFEVAQIIGKEKRAALVMANGAAILYAAAREAIASITGRFAKGMVILPSVNFVDDANRFEKDAIKKGAKGAPHGKPKKGEKEKAEATKAHR